MKRWLSRSNGLFLGLIVLAFYFTQLGSPLNALYPPGSAYSDLMLTHWPNAFFFKQAVWQFHSWPLWNPNQMLGLPFAANPLSGLWYPPGWLVLLLPVLPALNILLAFHLVLGGWGMQRLIAQHGGSRISGLAAGLAWSLSPKIWAHLGAGHAGLVYAAGWLPWIAGAAMELAGAGPAWSKISSRCACRLGLFWALQFLADPRLAAYTAAGLVVFFFWRLIVPQSGFPGRERYTTGLKDGLKHLPAWAAAGLLSLGLAAVQWLPLLAYLPLTGRPAITAGESAALSLPVSYLLGLVWPNLGGFHEWMTYAGVSVLVLAFLGWLGLGRKDRWGFTLGLLLLILYVLGDNGPLYRLAAALPGASLLRVPPRAWFLAAFGFAALAGLGVDQLRSAGERQAGEPVPVLARNRRLLNYLAVASAVAFGVSAVFISFLTRNPRSPALLGFIWFILVVFLAAVSRSILPAARSLMPAVVLLVLVELIWFDRSLVVRRTDQELFSDGAVTAAALAGGQGRVYAPSFRPPQQVATAMGIRLANGVEPLLPTAWVDFINTAAGVPDAMGYSVTLPPLPEGRDPATALAGTSPDPDLMALLDVKRIVSQFPISAPGFNLEDRKEAESLMIYKNRVDLDWPAVYRRVSSVPDFDSAMAWLEEGDLENGAVVIDGGELAGPEGRFPARTVDAGPNREVVEASGPGLLVLSELYLPGWKANVDGVDSPVVPVDGVLRGVYIEAGPHRVEFIYRPWAVAAGCVVSGLSLLLWFVCRKGGLARAENAG